MVWWSVWWWRVWREVNGGKKEDGCEEDKEGGVSSEEADDNLGDLEADGRRQRAASRLVLRSRKNGFATR